MNRFADWLVKRASWIALVGTTLAILGSYFSVKLYLNLHPDIEELLPESTRSVKDFDEVARRLKSVESLVILVFSKNQKQTKLFMDALGKSLNAVPKSTISFVSYRIDSEVAFSRKREPLFIELPDLINIRNYVRDRISYEKRVAFNIFPEADPPPKPQLDVDKLKSKYQERASEYTHFPDSYYTTPDENVHLLVAYMPGKGLENAHRIKAAVVKAVAELNPKSFSPDMEIKYTGNVENLIEESAALVADLEFSTVVVLVLEVLALLIFYRSFRMTAALVVSLVMGTFWSFGLAYFHVAYLNANTAFLASILLGNGINFGIVFLARYAEERRKGKDNRVALEIAMKATAPATAVGAIACGLSYGSLMLTEFRGFNQFGFIGLIGMILCWISSYLLMPAFLTLIDRFSPANWSEKKQPKALIAEPIARLIERHSGAICIVVAFVSALSLLSFFNYRPGELIETDLSKLKDKRSQLEGSESLYHYIDDVFGHSLSPMAILPSSRAEAHQIASILKKTRDSQGKSSLITTVQTISDFVPDDQEKKIALIKEIQGLIKPSMLEGLSETDRSMAEAFLNAKDIKPFTQDELPIAILDRFRENDGTTGKIVVIDKVVDTTGKDDAANLISFVKTAREATDQVAPGAPVAGTLPIVADMVQAISQDGPRATLISFLLVSGARHHPIPGLQDD